MFLQFRKKPQEAVSLKPYLAVSTARELFAVHHVTVLEYSAEIFVRGERLRLIAEVEERQHFLLLCLFAVIPADAENVIVPRLNKPSIRRVREHFLSITESRQCVYCVEEFSFRRGKIFPLGRILPVKRPAVNVSAVGCLVGVVVVRVVVELSDFVAAVVCVNRNA